MSVREASNALREGRHTSRKSGTVVEIGRSYDHDGLYRVEIELPYRRSKKKPKFDAPEYKPRDTITVSKEFAQALTVGDTITIETHVTRG